MSRVIITGPSGGAPNRLEINTFVKDEKFFSLYIQALQLMQNVNQDDYQSFFQVGGIHGIPYTPWDGAVGNPNAAWGGYCTHASVLFPTWHRPYVSLYEQILQRHAVIAASSYTVNQTAWKQAASDLRQPYWDWAVNSVPPAEIISQARVTITGPAGTRITVDNPILQYRFHPIPPQFTGDLRSWPTTLRNPTGSGSGATSDVIRMTNVLRNAQSNITSNTYAMLTRVHTWDAFSNTRVTPGTAANSVEGVHNGIHNNVGGGGHMSRPTVAAFDPIFQLHHANVDRMLSLWAALNPGIWVSHGSAFDGTFTIPANSSVDGSTQLAPFWNTQNTFWASNATTDTTRLGYTYPEFNGLDMGNRDAVRTAIGAIVNRLYGASVFGNIASHSQAAAATPATHAPGQVLLATSVAPPDHGVNDWVVRIQFKKFELGTSFSVPIFLGPVPDDPKEWLLSPNFVGAHHAFVNDNPDECENCRNQVDLVEEGFVHLNRDILKHSHLDSLEQDVIAPYLTKELHWRVIKADGEPVELKSLEVNVMSTPLTYPAGAMFPIDSAPRHHHQITFGRKGGSHHA